MDPVLGLHPEEGLRLLLIGTVFSSFLIPVAVVLFYFSGSPLRRRPVFGFNVFSILLGITEGAIIIYTFGQIALHPQVQTSPTLLTVFSSLVLLIPPCVQSILLFQLVPDYYSRLLSIQARVALHSPMVAMKAARVATASVLLSRASGNASGGWRLNMTYVQVLCILQLFDDIYACSLLAMRPSFLTRLRTLPRRSPQTIMRIALTTFAIPILLDIVQVVQAFLNLRFAAEMYVPLVNNYVQIVCVLLATVWMADDQDWLTVSARGHDLNASSEDGPSRIPYFEGRPFEERPFEELTSPSLKEAFSGNVRDSSTAVGEEDAEERLKWLAELGKEGMHGPTPPSLCTAATFDNTGQPAPSFYAV